MAPVWSAAQVAVDTQHHLIITHEVTNDGTDRAQLANIAGRAKQVLGVDELKAVADRGYYSGEEILECHTAGIVVTLPKPMTSGVEVRGRFGKQDRRGRLSLSGRRKAGVPLHQRGKRPEAAALLDQCLPRLRTQETLYDRQGATHLALGA